MKKLLVQKNLLIDNIEKIKAYAKKSNTEVIAMLKGNGYGLGICEFASLLLQNGIKTLAVSEFFEAKQLREYGIDSEIILLSPMCDLNEAADAVKLGIVCAVGSEESANVLSIAAEQTHKTARAHICLDTGFGRFGFLAGEADRIHYILSKLERISIEGIFTHLSDAFGDENNSRRQFELFKNTVLRLEEQGYNFKIKHICNSSAFVRFSDMHMDAVRIGSAFLGRLPIKNNLNLNKIAYIESCICEIKTLPKGHNIGYANTYMTKKETKIAVVPVGYKDGFGVQKVNDAFRFKDILRYIYKDIRLFLADNCIYVKIKGKKCRLLGRVSMFNIIVDITGIDAEVGDSVFIECNPILIDSSIEREYI